MSLVIISCLYYQTRQDATLLFTVSNHWHYIFLAILARSAETVYFNFEIKPLGTKDWNSRRHIAEDLFYAMENNNRMRQSDSDKLASEQSHNKDFSYY